jgi:hypothetical protein
MIGDNGTIYFLLKQFKVIMGWPYLVTNFQLVVGNCYAAKPSARTPGNGGGLRASGEHQQVLRPHVGCSFS